MACVLVAAEENGTRLKAIMLKDAVDREFVRAGGPAEDKRRLQTRSAPSVGKEILEKLRGTVFSFVGGRYPMALMLHRHPLPFDVVLPEAPELPIEPRADIIPVKAMRAVLEKGAKRALQTLEKIVEASPGAVYQFESPPPLADSSMFKEGSAQPYLRYKLWHLYSVIVREHSERIGAHFVSRPDAAVDENGFLRPELALTTTHANPAYGALVLEQMEALR
jgi:hypothetical protein